VTRPQVAEFDAHGPRLQLAMFAADRAISDPVVADIAERARARFASW